MKIKLIGLTIFSVLLVGCRKDPGMNCLPSFGYSEESFIKETKNVKSWDGALKATAVYERKYNDISNGEIVDMTEQFDGELLYNKELGAWEMTDGKYTDDSDEYAILTQMIFPLSEEVDYLLNRKKNIGETYKYCTKPLSVEETLNVGDVSYPNYVVSDCTLVNLYQWDEFGNMTIFESIAMGSIMINNEYKELINKTTFIVEYQYEM